MSNYKRITLRLLAPALMLAGFIPILGAQHIPPQVAQQEETLRADEEAITIPISDKKITLVFTVDGRETIQATQLEGGLIRMEKEGGSTYGFTPYIADDGTIAVRVFNIYKIVKKGKLLGEGIREVETLQANRESDETILRYADNDSSFTIQVKGVQKKPKENVSKQDYGLAEEAAGNKCCITCSGIKTCACEVVASCGTCCFITCCD